MLYIKKEKVLDKRALKGNQGVADNSTTDNNGLVFKEIRPVKLDFSATNFKAKVTGWRLSIEKKADTLFPTVCDIARGIAGITAATVDLTRLEHQDPQILARANLASEDEDTVSEHEKDNTQTTNIHKNTDNGIDEDIQDDHRDNNGVDNGNNSGVDEDHNNRGDDLDGHDKKGDNSDGHDKCDKRVDSEEDEDNSQAIYSSNDGDFYDNDHDDENEEENYAEPEGSDLTEIGLSSDVGKVVLTPSRKGVQHGRH